MQTELNEGPWPEDITCALLEQGFLSLTHLIQTCSPLELTERVPGTEVSQWEQWLASLKVEANAEAPYVPEVFGLMLDEPEAEGDG